MSPQVRRYLPAAAVVLILVGVGVTVQVNNERGQPVPPEVFPVSTRAGGKPNVLTIMTDDQTLEAMRVLDNVHKYIATPGTTFENYFVSFPNCCPSRATYMTGQFAHNDNVRDNVQPNGGWKNFRPDETLPVWLQRVGYHTTSIGKFLNDWGADGNIAPPPGWSHWFGLIDPTTYHYYGYSVSNDGRRQDYLERPEDYSTDVLGAEVVKTIKDRATADQPWFISWTPLAPHAQEGEKSGGQNESENATVIDKIRATLPVPADRYKGKMAKENLPKPPSFNQRDVSQMPEFVQKKPVLGIQQQGLVREGYTRELEALLSVDEWIGKIFTTLEKTKQLDNTVVLFTSDNGFFHGEHRLTFAKVYLYEPGVHLPFIARGGPFAKGATVKAVAGNVDLAPTIMALAGAASPLTLDGRDLTKVARDPNASDGRGMLLENWTNFGQDHTSGIRTDRWKYLNNDKGEEELYDLRTDPDELNNLVHNPDSAPVKGELRARADKLSSCAGKTCEGADGHGG